MASAASGPIFTNHCVDTSGSTTVPQRSQCPTACRWSAIFSSSPSCCSCSTIALRALNRSCPAYGPASFVIRPSSSITATLGSEWRLPIAKSFGSCPGVTFTAPVPNAGSTNASAMIGSSRPTTGSFTRVPTMCR